MIHRYGLISDTHGHLHPRVLEHFAGVDAIFHAGDVGGDPVIVELEAVAPTRAVAGNVDAGGVALPPMRVLELPFGKLVLTHSHLVEPTGSDPERLARHFASQKPRMILFGHSHQQYVRLYKDIWLVNPGPATKPRFHERPSIVVMTWDSERDSFGFEFIPLDWKEVGSQE